ncbi:flagellar biosynthesis protein FliQ [Geoalkalibacter halelectricus]|uniref:Flagellar biosynthetic protein FliQ n=1 Tax=Geoalkalibacter halelectricus TaxID=2847045 RepID=A0ABY5ZGY3_9BACT|nr:flagellar biosynthesis protein FliQ [Geoalkalibacter halelectricus]MDO3378063.1 flagellar biosynthesis protein FliQ [Geoalkalibacter halelectricus]UWZ78361.1 flagellar biosynthesis protein FliQ [Geoalkalibacter halelectricus]
MTPEFVVDIGRQAVETVLMVAGPLLIVALGTGLTIAVFQAATQINEQTMTFIPKIVAVLVTLLIMAPWMIKTLLAFTTRIYGNIHLVGG